MVPWRFPSTPSRSIPIGWQSTERPAPRWNLPKLRRNPRRRSGKPPGGGSGVLRSRRRGGHGLAPGAISPALVGVDPEILGEEDSFIEEHGVDSFINQEWLSLLEASPWKAPADPPLRIHHPQRPGGVSPAGKTAGARSGPGTVRRGSGPRRQTRGRRAPPPRSFPPRKSRERDFT